ncbi:MAG: carotenoid biosynthesis protein [Gemmatimonadales bacterium]|nr:MAG: carotenoid biosynthesis protein [Gemmatimonadales bacterium]
MAGERVTVALASSRGWARTPAGIGVWGLLAFTVVALAGYGVFGQNPHLIPAGMIGFWQISYSFFARFHIIVGAAAIAVALVAWAGLRWLPSLVAVYLLALLAEYVGTGSGLPFGAYEYTTLLGTKIGDQVPWVIPLSWYLMVLPAWIIARNTFPADRQWAARMGFAAVILTIWDLALDPAMSFESPLYWVWGDSGPYYGMPWLNLVGWLGTGVVLAGAMEGLGIRRWGRTIPVGWALAYYGITLLMPLGMLVIKGFWLAVIVTVLACLGAVGIHWQFGPRRVKPGRPDVAASPMDPAAPLERPLVTGEGAR